MNNQNVITTKGVIRGLESVTRVIHDFEGDWQILGNRNVTVDEAMVVSLDQILNLDKSLEKLLSMGNGKIATRIENSEDWIVEDYEY